MSSPSKEKAGKLEGDHNMGLGDRALDFIRRLSSATEHSINYKELAQLANINGGVTVSPHQRELVRHAWKDHASCKHGDSAGGWIFLYIFAQNPELKEMFKIPSSVTKPSDLRQDPVFIRHSKTFTNLLEMCVESMDALEDSLGPLLLSYGAKHVHFEKTLGFTPDMWELFAEAMYAYGRSWKLRRKKEETLEAWRLLIFFIIHNMYKGYNLEKQSPRNK